MPEEPGWYPDPKNEANFRFYDGRKWTKSVAAQRPGEERVDDGPVEGGLMGLLEHQPVNTPEDPEVGLRPPPAYTSLDAPTPSRAPAWSEALPPPRPDAAPAPAPSPPPPPPPAPAAAPPPPPPPPPADEQRPPPPPPPPPPA